MFECTGIYFLFGALITYIFWTSKSSLSDFLIESIEVEGFLRAVLLRCIDFTASTSCSAKNIEW